MTQDAPITVAQLNRLARETLERGIPLLWVAGEVSNLTRAASGHVYFTLKDAAAQVRCVMFRSRAQLLPWQLENGQQVEARGLVSVYEPRGDFQFGVETLRRGGLGRLFEAFARLKDALAAEGLFAEARKRTLPRYPSAIGIVTSPQAAALRDLLAALRRRAPHVPIVVYPTPVQGNGAAERIAAAIATANARGECQVLIVARGGGSLEDLWAFNEEIVARATAASAIPVISGVGHETDTTIVDFVADRRAATPTAAAVLASAGWCEAAQEIAALRLALRHAQERRLHGWMQCVDVLAHRLVHPADAIELSRRRIEQLRSRLGGAAERRLRRDEGQVARARLALARGRPSLDGLRTRIVLAGTAMQTAAAAQLAARRHTVSRLSASLAALDPQATLQRGFSIVRDAQGRVIRSSAQLAVGSRIGLDFADGSAAAEIVDL